VVKAKQAKAELRRALRVVGFGAVTAVMLPAYAVRDALTRQGARDDVRNRWIRAWTTALLRMFGVGVEVRGEAPSGAGLLVVANHRSTIDIAVLLQTFGGHMVSRADLAKWPLIGAAARKVGTVFVDRADASSGANAIRAIRDLLQRGRTVCLFPEGTTFPDDEVQPFHPGAFAAAARTGACVVPVGIVYESGSGVQFVNETFPQHLSRIAGADPTRVVVCVGAPIATEKTKAADLCARTHASVQTLVNEARARVDQR
jgi:lyso-ornithine lipid O-acyltransferase